MSGVETGVRTIAEHRSPAGAFVVLRFDREWASNAGRLLHPVERTYAARFGEPRRETWAAGRAALRLALALAGYGSSGPILPDRRGAPFVGRRLSGSISHKRALVAAAVRNDGATVGIDVECLEPARSRIARRVLTPQELNEVSSLQEEERWPAIAVRFSVKEAVYKATDPWVQDEVGFEDVSVEPLADGRVAVRHALESGGRSLEITATWAVINRAVVALATCRRPGWSSNELDRG